MTRFQGMSRSELTAVGLAALLCAGLMTLAPMLASEARAARQPWSSTTSALVNPCAIDGTPQICEPAHLHKVRVPLGKVIKVKRLRYTAPLDHCSSVRLRVFLNGQHIATTPWVDTGEAFEVELLDLTLRRRPEGRAHRFTYKGEGKVGGCNGGSLGSWGGDIRLSGFKRST